MKSWKLFLLRKILRDKENRKNNVRNSLVGWYDIIIVVLLVFVLWKLFFV